MIVGEGLICLLQPFVWPHVYAPVLPATLTHFLDAPVPYIMGMRHQLTPQTGAQTPSTTPRGSLASLQSFANFGLASETNVCYLDIDSGRVHSTDVDLPPFPNAVELQHNIESILAVYQRHCHFSSPSSRSAAPRSSSKSRISAILVHIGLNADHRFGKTACFIYPSLLSRGPRGSGVGTNTPPNLDNTEAPPTGSVPVIKRPLLDLNPPVMQRSASSRLIEQIAATSIEPERPQLHHSATDSSFSSHTKTPEKPRSSEAYPSKQYFSTMHEIAASMTAKKELTEYSDLLKFNYAIREVFINHLAEIFVDFETFIVLGANSSENPEGNTAAATATNAHNNSGLQAFDKVGFLSDCPETHMAFLSPFLETQMFATFLDTNLTTLSANQVRRCSKCGAPPSNPSSTTMSIQTSPSTTIVSAFLSRIRALKAQALAAEKPQRPATDRLSRKFLPPSTTHTPVVDSRARRRDPTCAGIPKSPFDCIQYCKGPAPHPLFSKIKPTFIGLTTSPQHGQFRLLDGSLLSKAPANRQCGSESPPPQHPPPSAVGVSVPSPLLSDAELIGPSSKEESPVLFQIVYCREPRL
ncbi:unnamed protein product [Rodentolepis nana]|uniref:UDENN domain-containing protein n=1 Tax=Rodentolepis nana TaxID=102285 RepID=A0A0R3TAE4_RODNA|nr:unnamed protein product [Rodentolepis nana]